MSDFATRKTMNGGAVWPKPQRYTSGCDKFYFI